MAFTVESGVGLAGANSFASVAEGDTYAEKHLYATDWTGATNANKEKALMFATRLIDAAIEWTGRKKVATQGLGWPREYAIESENPSYVVGSWPTTYYTYYDDDSVPKGVKDATCELARELLKADRTAENSATGIKSIGLGQGAVEIEFDATDRAGLFTDVVKLLLRPFGVLIAGAGGTRFVRIQRG